MTPSADLSTRDDSFGGNYERKKEVIFSRPAEGVITLAACFYSRCRLIYLTITFLRRTKSFYERLIPGAFGKLCRANMTRSSII